MSRFGENWRRGAEKREELLQSPEQARGVTTTGRVRFLCVLRAVYGELLYAGSRRIRHAFSAMTRHQGSARIGKRKLDSIQVGLSRAAALTGVDTTLDASVT
jgi:hypothetical protein